MKNEYKQILTKLFGGEFPGFVTEAGRNFLKIRLQGDGIRTVRLQDVLEEWKRTREVVNGRFVVIRLDHRPL